jgi:hypothetical protein
MWKLTTTFKNGNKKNKNNANFLMKSDIRLDKTSIAISPAGPKLGFLN